MNPEGSQVSECRLHYVGLTLFQIKGFAVFNNSSYELEPLGASVPCVESPAEIGSGTEPVPVHAEVSGLSPDLYHFRLEADNAYENAVAGLAVAFGLPAPPAELPVATPTAQPAPGPSALAAGTAATPLDPATAKRKKPGHKKHKRGKHKRPRHQTR